MTIRVTCECGKQLLAPDELIGQVALCPACQRPMTLPDHDAAIPPISIPPLSATASGEIGIKASFPEQGPANGPVTSKRARWSMILGLSSLVVPFLLGIPAGTLDIYLLGLLSLFAPFLLGIPAIILGTQALRAIRWYPEELRGKGMAGTGSILGAGAIAATLIAGILLGPVSKGKKAAARIQSVSRLKQMGVVLHTYHDGFGHFPTENPPANLAGRSMLSWRVQILATMDFMEVDGVKLDFHHDEPWDSPHNIELLPHMPYIYLDPRFQSKSDRKKGMTYYRGFVGPGGVFGANPPANLVEITKKNGASNTVMVIEAGEPVPWTKPEDPSFDENSPLGGPMRVKVFAALFADGHVQTLPQNFDRKMIGRMINWQNTEPVNLP